MNKMRTCLVIIDMQKGFINQHTEHLIDKISEYIKTQEFTKIVATRYINHENTACYKLENWKECLEGSDDIEIVDKLKPFIEKTFNKDKYSCWNKEFKEFVELNEFDILYFVGVNTGCCVLASVFDAHNDLYDTRVVAELCGSTSGEESHQAGLRILRDCLTKNRVI